MRETPLTSSFAYATNNTTSDILAGFDHRNWKATYPNNAALGLATFPETMTAAQVRLLNKRLEQKQPEKDVNMSRRLVQVFVADANENVPVDKCLLYKGEPVLTELTDQELFFELDVKGMLDKHNAYRITLPNKSLKDRQENLEPVRIRDLKMVVITIASF